MAKLSECLDLFNISQDDLFLPQFQAQIIKIAGLKVEKEKQHEQEKFINSLKHLFEVYINEIFVSLRDQLTFDVHGNIISADGAYNDSFKNSLLASAPVNFMQETVETLSKNTYRAENQKTDYDNMLNYGKKYQTLCDKNPRLKNFAKGVYAALASGLSFVLGFPIGAIFGFARGLQYCLIGALLTTPYDAVTCAIDSAKAANNTAKKATHVYPGSTLRNLTFRTPALESATGNVGKMGASFFRSSSVIEKNDAPLSQYNTSLVHGF